MKSNRKRKTPIRIIDTVESPKIRELILEACEEAIDGLIAEIASGEVTDAVYKAMINGGWISEDESENYITRISWDMSEYIERHGKRPRSEELS